MNVGYSEVVCVCTVGGEEDEEEEQKKNRPRWSRSLSVIQITDEEAAALSKTPDKNISVSEKILLESASEKNRISEVKVLFCSAIYVCFNSKVYPRALKNSIVKIAPFI